MSALFSLDNKLKTLSSISSLFTLNTTNVLSSSLPGILFFSKAVVILYLGSNYHIIYLL